MNYISVTSIKHSICKQAVHHQFLCIGFLCRLFFFFFFLVSFLFLPVVWEEVCVYGFMICSVFCFFHFFCNNRSDVDFISAACG